VEHFTDKKRDMLC